MMKLSKIASGYVFMMGDTIIDMGDHGRMFRSRKAAVAAARAQGIAVASYGKCIVAKVSLDELDAESAMVFWSIFHRPSRSDAELLVGNRRPGFTVLSSKLAEYALNASKARRLRSEGHIEWAMSHEAQNERIYAALPVDCRW